MTHSKVCIYVKTDIAMSHLTRLCEISPWSCHKVTYSWIELTELCHNDRVALIYAVLVLPECFLGFSDTHELGLHGRNSLFILDAASLLTVMALVWPFLEWLLRLFLAGVDDEALLLFQNRLLLFVR